MNLNINSGNYYLTNAELKKEYIQEQLEIATILYIGISLILELLNTSIPVIQIDLVFKILLHGIILIILLILYRNIIQKNFYYIENSLNNERKDFYKNNHAFIAKNKINIKSKYLPFVHEQILLHLNSEERRMYAETKI